ncbi:MAG: ABC transporter permease [Pseudochelatococcus sp.]|uniref:ABC transporter permease n=1 Tax=Pseudochelatococcus sp. TaxID=2020869 RepID=UPI003D8A35BD
MRWRLAAFAVAAFVCLPVAALILTAFEGSAGLWPHMIRHVLPAALRDTIVLLAGVGVLTTLIGTTTAWIVTAYEFPGRRFLEWGLLLPLAVPTYIIAFAYLDILHPVGSVQGALRYLLGYTSPRAFRLPDIRSMWGCILLLGLVLYPYVYLTTRSMFLTQAASLVEVSRTLGSSRGDVFRRVALPLARPAIAVGVSLALMETLNDIGASEFLGVRTLTVSVYTTWVSRSDMPGAAQISLAMLVMVVGLVLIERHARRNQRYTAAAQRPRAMSPAPLAGLRAAGAFTICFLPVALGFIAPAIYLCVEAYKRYRFAGLSQRLLGEVVNTVSVAFTATVLVLLCGLVVAYAARTYPGRLTAVAVRVSTLGYAIPGTVLALGLLMPIGAFDRMLSGGAETFLGLSVGLVLLGSGAAIVLAYCARFMAIATGGIEAGFSRISPSLDHAARTLGRTSSGVFRHVHLPLSRPALVSAGLLVFVDCMKELPVTLLLRPLNFETLATHLYGEAARGTYEEASIAALLIVVIGILPVVVLSRVGRAAPSRPSSDAAGAPSRSAGGLLRSERR